LIIGLQTWGTEGDIRPFIALAAGLSGAGHDVTLSVTEIRSGDYSSYGDRFGFRVLHPGRTAVSEAEFASLGRSMVACTSPALKSRLLVSSFLNPVLDEMYGTAEDLCSRCDLVIGHLFAYSLNAAAARAGVPRVSLYTTPLFPSSLVSPPGFPEFKPMVWWKAFDSALNLLWKPDISDFFERRGLKKPGSVFKDVFFSECLNLVAVSPLLYPGGNSGGYSLCGAMEVPEEGEADAAVIKFIADGTPPVYITFGSMLFGESDIPDLMGLLVGAVERTGRRAVIQAGHHAVDQTGSDDVLFVSKAPHKLLFPGCCVIIHHGGCGTSHTACSSGVPSVVVEYTADQPLWGRILKMAGVAPAMLHRRSLTSLKLAGAIEKVLESPSYGRCASALAEGMRNEDGVSTAVSLIEKKFGGRHDLDAGAACGSFLIRQ